MCEMNEIFEKIKFINQNDLNKHVIKRISAEINNEGGICSKLEMVDQVALSCSNPNGNGCMTLETQIREIFSILDNYISIIMPNNNNKKFIERYKDLTSSNDKEIIFKETYRIFMFLRNTVEHNVNNVHEHKDKIDFNGLNIEKGTLYWLYSLVCEYFSDTDLKYYTNDTEKRYLMHISKSYFNNISLYYSKYYHLAVLRFYYKKIRDNLIKTGYKDRISKCYGLSDISYPIIIYIDKPRYELSNVTFNINNDSIKISLLKSNHYRVDYQITYNNENYCIPEEALSSEGTINIIEINKWKITNI